MRRLVVAALEVEDADILLMERADGEPASVRTKPDRIGDVLRGKGARCGTLALHDDKRGAAEGEDRSIPGGTGIGALPARLRPIRERIRQRLRRLAGPCGFMPAVIGQEAGGLSIGREQHIGGAGRGQHRIGFSVRLVHAPPCEGRSLAGNEPVFVWRKGKEDGTTRDARRCENAQHR